MNASNVSVVLKIINTDEPRYYPMPFFAFLVLYQERLGRPDPTLRAKARPSILAPLALIMTSEKSSLLRYSREVK